MSVARRVSIIAAGVAMAAGMSTAAAGQARAAAKITGVAVPEVYGMTAAIAKTVNVPVTEVTSAGQAESDVAAGTAAFAGVTSGPNGLAPPGLLWIGLARQAVSWTRPAGAAATKPVSLTLAQLQGIYDCTITNWSMLGGANQAIVPVLPEAGSAMRAFFLAAIGVATPGSCVADGTINIPGDPANPVPIDENTGVSPTAAGGACSKANWALCLTGNAYEFATRPGAIFPYSASDWIAQEPPPIGGGHGNTARFDPGALMQPREIDGISPILPHPVGIDTLNPKFSAALSSLIWDVTLNAGTTSNPKIPVGLVPAFGKSGTWCGSTSIIQSWGFGTIGSECGTLLEAG